jgi:hypothetical protein
MSTDSGSDFETKQVGGQKEETLQKRSKEDSDQEVSSF